MPSFSTKSQGFLDTCHINLQLLFNEIVKTEDCTVICGHRGKEAQEVALLMGNSKAHWGQSKHNLVPSCAVDVMPYPVDWNNLQRIYNFSDIVKKKAQEMGIGILWGGDFVGFFDGPHYELTDISHSKLPEG